MRLLFLGDCTFLPDNRKRRQDFADLYNDVRYIGLKGEEAEQGQSVTWTLHILKRRIHRTNRYRQLNRRKDRNLTCRHYIVSLWHIWTSYHNKNINSLVAHYFYDQKLCNFIQTTQVPVILVGNKLDKKELEMSNKELDYINVRNIVKSLVKKYRQVQMGFECSAYYDRNVKKVLNGAQRAALYPLAPLYDLNSK